MERSGPKRKYNYSDVDIEHAAIYGVSLSVFRDRLRKGFEKGDAMTRPNTGKRGVEKKDVWFINGEKIPGELVQKARKNNLDYKLVRGRVIGGMTIEKAVEMPVTRKSLSLAEKKIILGNGISIKTYHSRLSKGWSKEKAMTKPINKKNKDEKEVETSVSSLNPSKTYKFKAEVKLPSFRKPIIIGYFKTLKDAAVAEKQALEELNRHE